MPDPHTNPTLFCCNACPELLTPGSARVSPGCPDPGGKSHLAFWGILRHPQSNWNKPSGVKDHSSTSTMEARFLYCATQYSED